FSEREVALMSRLAPHLAAGLKAAALQTAAAHQQTPPDGSAGAEGVPDVLILDVRGRVSRYTPAAGYWLRRLHGSTIGWQAARARPEVVSVAVGLLRRGMGAESEADHALVPQVRARTAVGEWVQLHAALGVAPDGYSGEIVVVIAWVGPRAIAWLRFIAYDLSARERKVVELVARGATTARITEALCIAEYTVQDHLKHLF